MALLRTWRRGYREWRTPTPGRPAEFAVPREKFRRSPHGAADLPRLSAVLARGPLAMKLLTLAVSTPLVLGLLATGAAAQDTSTKMAPPPTTTTTAPPTTTTTTAPPTTTTSSSTTTTTHPT